MTLAFKEQWGFLDKTNYGSMLVKEGQCSFDPARFDIYTEAQKFENFGPFWKSFFNASGGDNFGTFLDSSTTLGNEALLRTWEGQLLRNVAPHMAFYYEKGNSADAVEMRKLGEAVRKRTGVSIPVVEVDPSMLLLDGDKIKEPFSCVQ